MPSLHVEQLTPSLPRLLRHRSIRRHRFLLLRLRPFLRLSFDHRRLNRRHRHLHRRSHLHSGPLIRYARPRQSRLLTHQRSKRAQQ